MKCSRRDLGYVIGRRLNGACTVSATMRIITNYNGNGVNVFATGGIGGVHRCVEKYGILIKLIYSSYIVFDISFIIIIYSNQLLLLYTELWMLVLI